MRNFCIHKEGRITIHRALSIVWSSVREANKLGSVLMSNNIDGLQILHSLRIKVTTDSAALGSLRLASSLGIFHNCRGFVCDCFAIQIRIAHAFEAELVATIHVINFAWDRGWKYLWL